MNHTLAVNGNRLRRRRIALTGGSKRLAALLRLLLFLSSGVFVPHALAQEVPVNTLSLGAHVLRPGSTVPCPSPDDSGPGFPGEVTRIEIALLNPDQVTGIQAQLVFDPSQVEILDPKGTCFEGTEFRNSIFRPPTAALNYPGSPGQPAGQLRFAVAVHQGISTAGSVLTLYARARPGAAPGSVTPFRVASAKSYVVAAQKTPVPKHVYNGSFLIGGPEAMGASLPRGISGSVASDGSRIFAADDLGDLWVGDPSNRSFTRVPQTSSQRIGAPVAGRPVIHDGSLLLVGMNGKIQSFDAVTLSVRFRSGPVGVSLPEGAAIRSTPAAGDGKLYFTDTSGVLYAVDLSTGSLARSVALDLNGGNLIGPADPIFYDPDRSSTGNGPAEPRILIGMGKRVSVLRADDLTPLGEGFTTPGNISSPPSLNSEGVGWIGDDAGRIHTFAAATATPMSQPVAMDSPIRAAPAVLFDGSNALVAGASGKVAVVSDAGERSDSGFDLTLPVNSQPGPSSGQDWIGSRQSPFVRQLNAVPGIDAVFIGDTVGNLYQLRAKRSASGSVSLYRLPTRSLGDGPITEISDSGESVAFASHRASVVVLDGALTPDATPPVTTATVSHHKINGRYEAIVTLTATDEDFGVRDITYGASGAESLEQRTIAGDSLTLQFSRVGVTTLTFFSTDHAGNIEETRSMEVVVESVDPDRIITTIAGNGSVNLINEDLLSGDGGPATEAQLSYPTYMAVDPQGYLYFGNREYLRRIDSTGRIDTVAGRKAAWVGSGMFTAGDGGLALFAVLNRAVDIAFDRYGNLYIASHLFVRKITPDGVITTVAGKQPLYERDINPAVISSESGIPAVKARLVGVGGIAVDHQDNLYIAENGIIRKVTPDGIIRRVNLGRYMFNLRGLATDRNGNLYFIDDTHQRVMRLGTDGKIVAVAGGGSGTGSGDGAMATTVKLHSPWDVTVDSEGNLFIADGSLIRKVSRNGLITTVAGSLSEDGSLNWGFSGDGGPATQAQLRRLFSVAVDAAGNLLIADTFNNRIRKVESAAAPGLYAGLPLPSAPAKDTTPPFTRLNVLPSIENRVEEAVEVFLHAYDWKPGVKEITYSATGAHPIEPTTVPGKTATFTFTGTEKTTPTYFATDYHGNRSEVKTVELPRSDADGILTTIAGSGTWRNEFGNLPSLPNDLALINGSHALATILTPRGIAVDEKGDIFTSADTILKLDRLGRIYKWTDLPSFGPIVADDMGSLYFADDFQVKKRSPDGSITLIAGNGQRDAGWLGQFSGDGGPAVQASMDRPAGLALDAEGNLYIADRGNHRIRKVSPDGIITTVAGSGAFGFRSELNPFRGGRDFLSNGGYSGDGGPATQAQLNLPSGVAVDGRGSLYIVDARNQRVRKVEPTGTITTLAGRGPTGFDERRVRSAGGFSGDDVPATQAQFDFFSSGIDGFSLPFPGIAVDSAGTVFVSDTYNFRVRKISPDGVVSTVVGTGIENTIAHPDYPTGEYFGDGGPAVEAGLSGPGGLAIDGEGNLLIADTVSRRIRKVNGVAAPGLLAGRTLPPPEPVATPTFQPGDVNGDNQVTVEDVILILKFIVGLFNPPQYQRAAADMDRNGIIDIRDAIRIIRAILKIE